MTFGHDTIKRKIFEMIEVSKDNDPVSKAYDKLILTAVIIGLIPLMMKSENQYTKLIDLITVLIFLFDYSVRFYTSDYKMGIKSYKAYVAYVFTPMAIVDLLSIIPILTFIVPGLKFIAMFRIFRVARILKLIRYSKTMTTITNVLRRVKKQLYAVLLLTLMYICASALIIFQFEPGLFNNYFDAIYWATISITTVGYGDISPITTLGRLITIFSSLIGVAIIALPSGIITAAYMEEINKKKSNWEI